MRKPLYFVLAFAVTVIALTSLLLPQPFFTAIRQASMETLSPIWRVTDWAQYKISLFKKSFLTIQHLQKETSQLRTQNAQLAASNSQLNSLKQENDRLRQMLDYKTTSPFELLACRVIQRDPSDWWSAIIVNKGWADNPNLSPDQPVISPRGVIGKTTTVARYTTQVILIVDQNCKVSAEVTDNRAHGILIGATEQHGSPLCQITFVSRETPLSKGASVYTSGLGGIFPQGLLIGTIQEAPPLSSDRNFGLYREALVKPAVNLEDLQELFIIIGSK